MFVCASKHMWGESPEQVSLRQQLVAKSGTISQVRGPLKHREGSRSREGEDRWDEIQLHVRIIPSDKQDAAGVQAATRGQGAREAAQLSLAHRGSSWSHTT